MNFADLGLNAALQSACAAQGWNEPTPVQEQTIPAVLAGSDVLCAAPTGTGKSAAFLLPALMHLSLDSSEVQMLILEPTRELAAQTAKTAAALAGDEQAVRTIVGGADRVQQRDQSAPIAVATPGRLAEFLAKEWIALDQVKILVIDEADRMLDLGFKDEVLGIVAALKQKTQSLLFSATLEGFGIKDFAAKVLHDPVSVNIEGAEGKLPDNLSAGAYYVNDPNRKLALMQQLLTTVPGKSVIFVRTRAGLMTLGASLRRRGFQCALLQGDFSQRERNAALSRFCEGKVQILLATDVAARGLDVPDISVVYNYDLPQDAAVYVHRAGRTARAGKDGKVVSLVSSGQIALLEQIERYTGQPIQRRVMKEFSNPFAERDKKTSPRKGEVKSKTAPDFKHERKPHVKHRLRDRLNKGKPDFAAKRARKAARLAATATPAAKSAED